MSISINMGIYVLTCRSTYVLLYVSINILIYYAQVYIISI